MISSALQRAMTQHEARWGPPDLVARAPGRVNLIGEHTDYNDGFALPMAIQFDTVVAMTDTRAETGSVSVIAEGFGSTSFDPSAPGFDADVAGWARHLVGVARELERRGIDASGWSAAIASDIPVGAGLSSSAAVEVAVTTALLARADVEWSPLEVAIVGLRAENDFVGVQSGIMDQLISAGAREGNAGLMDCRALTLEHTPVPDGVAIAVLDTTTRRTLANGAYDDRRRACERAASALGVRSLRDAEFGDLAAIPSTEDRRRARHVVTENERTVRAADAMRVGDRVELGRLMVESHRSLQSDFDVSGPGLDAIVEAALDAPGCFGARMTGGGFAGRAVAAIDANASDAFVRTVVERYRFEGRTAKVWLTVPAAGAALISDRRGAG